MKTAYYCWMTLITLLVGVSPAFGDTFLIAETGSDERSRSTTIQVLSGHVIEAQTFKVPVALQRRVAARAVKAGYRHSPVLQLKIIHLKENQVVVVGQRLVSGWEHRRQQPSLWLQEVRVTIPRVYLANSWDVHSLQRELERLGIKVKPKPAAPKPTPQQLAG